MRALRFEKFGDPSVLEVKEIARPTPGPDEALVEVKAASINPSDVGNVFGRFEQTTLPRTPGRDYAGVVVEGPAAWIGAEVWGTGDGGFARDGAHAQFIKVPAASLKRKPSILDFPQAASAGVTFLAAWIGVVEYAQLTKGETLVVVGAAGGVGGAAVQIGLALGARVIGIDRAAPPEGSPASRFALRNLTPEDGEPGAIVRELTSGSGAQVCLNAVGRETFEPSLGTLGHLGRMAVIASPGKPRVEFDLTDFYHRELRLFGVDTLKRDMTASAAVLDALAPRFEAGELLAPAIDRIVGLEEAREAYLAVVQGAKGRVVLAP
jgi:NADPH:quinone reductase-like Zn-dependent oxidoreductase